MKFLQFIILGALFTHLAEASPGKTWFSVSVTYVSAKIDVDQLPGEVEGAKGLRELKIPKYSIKKLEEKKTKGERRTLESLPEVVIDEVTSDNVSQNQKEYRARAFRRDGKATVFVESDSDKEVVFLVNGTGESSTARDVVMELQYLIKKNPQPFEYFKAEFILYRKGNTRLVGCVLKH